MRTGQFLINFVNTAPLYNNLNTSSCSYWVTVHVFRTAGLSLVDLVTCLILSRNIAYKTKQIPVFKKNPLSVEATNTTGCALKSTDGVYIWNGAHGGCDRSAGDAHSSAAPGPAFAFVGSPCCPTLEFVIAFWIMITFYILSTSLFCTLAHVFI